MRFGTFMFPLSRNPENDGQVIDSALREAELAEEVGFDAVWLTEHHFDGTTAYVDPLTFGAAVAVRTKRVKIGFAVVQLALHHPVRLAAQATLLDNLSHGRLIVGIGRGSSFNHYEYIGFGLTLEEGRQRLAEAEDLLVKAWTTENLRYEGKFFHVAFPMLRPRPYQKPHPPLVRACSSEGSIVAMAKVGRPILLAVHSKEDISRLLGIYHEAMQEAGLSEETAERVLDETWVARHMFVADDYSEAREVAEEGHRRRMAHEHQALEQYNPAGVHTPPIDPVEHDFQEAFIVGTPGQAADQIAELRDLGVRNLLSTLDTGEMDPRHVERSMRLIGEKVMPHFR